MILTKRLNLFEEFKIDIKYFELYYYSFKLYKKIEQTGINVLRGLFEYYDYIYYDYKNDKIANRLEIHNNYDELEANLIVDNLYVSYEHLSICYFCFGDFKNLLQKFLIEEEVIINKKNILLYQINLDLPYDYLDDITKKFYACGFNLDDITPDNIDYIIQLLD